MTVFPAKIPMDDSSPLKPTHAFYITHQKHQIQVQPLTEHLSDLYSHDKGPNLHVARDLIEVANPPAVEYTLRKENLFGSHVIAKDADGKEVAQWKHPIWTLHAGRTIIKFLPGAEGPDSKEEEVKVQLTGEGRKAESFVHNGVTFIWEIEQHYHGHKLLYKVLDLPAPAQPPEKLKQLIADFAQRTSHNSDGLLVIDAGEIGDLVGILTLCAVLEGPAKEESSDVVGSMAFAGLMG